MELVTNDASGGPTLADMGASFAIATGGVLTLMIAASPNAGSVWVRRGADEVAGAVFPEEVTPAALPASDQTKGDGRRINVRGMLLPAEAGGGTVNHDEPRGPAGPGHPP